MNNITMLRSYLSQHHLNGFLIPRTDEYQSEFLASYAESRRSSESTVSTEKSDKEHKDRLHQDHTSKRA